MKVLGLNIYPKLIADDLVSFTMTENCPFSCAFCMRGDRRPNTITERVIDTVLSQVKINGILHLGGGEPLLHSKKAAYLINRIYEFGNKPRKIGVITNGSVGPQKFEEFISTLSGKNVEFKIIISNDYYHMQERQRLYKGENILLQRIMEYQKIMIKYGLNSELDDFNWMLQEYNSNQNGDGVWAIGRGKNIEGAKVRVRDFELYQHVVIKGRHIKGNFLIQPDGRITPSIDMSWEERDMHYGQEYNILNHPLRKILKQG